MCVCVCVCVCVLKIYTNLCNPADFVYVCATSNSLLSTGFKVNAGPWRPSRSVPRSL